MPGGNRTGPMGMGPMTGRAAGYCAGYGVPGYMNPMPGRGFGMGRGGRGGGHRWRHWYYATGLPGWARFGSMPGAVPFGPVPPATAPSPAVERKALQQQIELLQDHLKALQQRLADLDATPASEN